MSSPPLCTPLSYYQVQRVIFGDERVQNPKRNLSDVGLETRVRMAPNGRNATFYRLDVPQFVGMFVGWLEERFGDITTKIKSAVKSRSQPTEMKRIDSFSDEDDALPPLWFRQSEPEVVPSERVKTPWENAYRPEKEQTIADVWKIAHSQLEIQFDRASFDLYLKYIKLVDYDTTSQSFILAVKDIRNFDMVRFRLHRNIRRVLSDVFGQDVEISYVTYDDWRDRHR